MVDREPERGAIRNPFSRKTTWLKRNTSGSRWVIMDDTVARRPQVVHQKASFAPSLKAVSATPSRLDNEYWDDNDGASSLYSLSRPAVYDISEIPDTNFYGLDGPYTDDWVEPKASQNDPKVKLKRRYSSPDTPRSFGLPKLTKTSPFPNFRGTFEVLTPPLSNRSSPIPERPLTPNGLPANPRSTRQKEAEKNKEPPRHISWDEFRSSRASLEITSIHIPPKPAKNNITEMQGLLPTPQPNLRPEVGKKDKSKKAHIFAPEAKPAPTTSAKAAKTARKQSDTETIMKVQNLAQKLKVVYHQGPKGEGQKMWKGIQGMRTEKRELKRTRATIDRSKAQERQMDDVYAAAFDMPAPKSRVPISPPVPTRPAPLGVMRSPVAMKPMPGTLQRNWSEDGTKVSNASTRTDSSFDVPITVSQSVEHDAQVAVLDYTSSNYRVPKLDPALAPPPKGTQKKGLPPRPVPARGEQEPPELGEQEMMYKLRVGTSPPRGTSLPPPPKPPVAKSLDAPVGLGITIPTALSKSQQTLAPPPVSPRFQTPLSKSHDNLSSLSKATKAPKTRLADALSSFDTTSGGKDAAAAPKYPNLKEYLADLWATTKAKDTAKQHSRLKAKISAPRPPVAPYGFTANFDPSAGGVGGPNAALAVAPRIANPAFKDARGKQGKMPDEDGKGKGREVLHYWGEPRVVAPAPPLPVDSAVKADRKERKGTWLNTLTGPSAGVLDSAFKLKRADSDASFVCADSRAHEARYSAELHQQQQKPRRMSGVLDMMVFKGPVRQTGSTAKGQERAEKVRQRYEFEDESMVPEPLGVRKSEGETARGVGEGEVRDTRFYRPYDSLIGEYRKGWI